MKVGVHLGFGVPQSGGQFTFQHAVSQALAQVAKESRHSFVVFGSPDVLMPPAGNLQVVPIRRTLVERAYSRLYRTASLTARNLLGRDNTAPDFVEAKLFFKSGVDMMWYVGPFCFTMDIPYIYTLLDLQHLVQPYFPEVSNNGVWHYREKHYSVALRRASRIVISTHLGKAEVERFYQVPSERIAVLPYAAPHFDLSSGDTGAWVLTKYQIPGNYLFYPAQFWPQKNHVGLLQAVRLLRDKWNIRLPVVLVGSDKGNQAYVKDYARRLDLSEQVHLLGFVPREDLVALYQNAFALTMPTLVGPDNIPSLEAMALRCPVVTSNLPGFEEQLGNAALLVDPRDENEIAQAIKLLYENAEFRCALVQRGLEWTSRWSWLDYAKGVLAILDDFEPIRRCWSSAIPYTPKS